MRLLGGPRSYWNMMKAREKAASGLELSTVCVQLKLTSSEGGGVAGSARRQLETKSGRKVVTPQNYLIDKPKPQLPPSARDE